MATGLWSVRLLVAVAALLAVAMVAPTTVSANDGVTISGTVYSKNEDKQTIVLITDAFGVKNQPVTVDLKHFDRLFEAVGVGQPISLVVMPREFDSYLMTGLVSEGSYVGQQNLGTRENFQTRDSSIKAHVGNVPEDDESLSQQHRDNNLRRGEDDSQNGTNNQ